MLRELINTAEQRALSLSQIRRDGGTQPREGIDWDHVKDMQQALADGAALPAISVIYDGADYWLWDGFHRWHAYANNGKLEIPVVISQGTQDDAQWESFAANQAHGLKRTPSEKERAIRGALKHPKSAGMSNMAIAKHLGVSDKTVAQYREKMELSSEIPKITTRTVERNGQTYQQDTANIGAIRHTPPVMLAVWEAFAPYDGGEVSPGPAVASDEQILEWVASDGETAYHPSCTCKMGMDGMAVVDPATMKVHGLEGLRVADASAMPYVTNGNIYAPVMMLAEKAADLIMGNTPLQAEQVEFYRHRSE